MRQFLTSICVLAALALAGCGSNDNNDAPIGAVDTTKPAPSDEASAEQVAPGQPEGTGAASGTYKINGDQVIISIEGSPETFTLNGHTLVGNFGGEQVTFTRK